MNSLGNKIIIVLYILGKHHCKNSIFEFLFDLLTFMAIMLNYINISTPPII